MATNSNLNLAPPLVEFGKFEDLVTTGQTISSTVSPADNSFAVFMKNLVRSLPSGVDHHDGEDEQPIYFASRQAVPSSERRLFLTDTLLIFTAFRNLLKSAPNRESNWVQSDAFVGMTRKLAIDYVNFIKECWVHASQPIPRPGGLQYSSDHYRSLYTCFSLFVVLFLPEPGDEGAPLADELVEWLNTHFIEPSTEEGDSLSALDKPWEDEIFWPYLTRAILRGLSKASLFFLGALQQHPSDNLQRLTSTLIPLIETQPRLVNFAAEKDFAYAMRRWSDKVKALRIDMDRVPENDRFDEFDNWWDRLGDIVGILEGRSEVLQRVCEELGADWKEICVAWSVFVDPRLRRQDLPDVVAQVISELPPDPTDKEDMIHAALFSGQAVEALQHACQLDPWLSAHLADLMESLELVDSCLDEDSSLSLRDEYILTYADYLHSDPALWRVTVDYMYSCGDVGKSRGDEILLRVPLQLHEQNSDVKVNSRIRAGEIVGVLKDVNATCLEYQRENVRRTVCRIAAQTLVSDKDYGLAISYCLSAEDWRGVGRIVDSVLDEYITGGRQKFTQYALAIAPSVQELRTQVGIHGVFVHRLVFAVRFARFHELLDKEAHQDAASDLIAIFSEDIAPTSWWAIVLCDSIPLLRHNPKLLFSSSGASLLLHKLEEIFICTSQGAGDDYLLGLTRMIQAKDEKEALERLKAVRLALAHYFARCLVLDTDRLP
ncbi:Nup85 nucleoporin-domain-containing protein [Crepidotus variabilis]|uniref:Nuclear pore complex protein Nup85 n=1 Tax=Crepidotus variabilis TaxID=179855 RepID=A0A9P6EBQ3_9AGAR|nr:Nup85 nucleoporin-domain-containing protein [Crepidotus variabilis]